MSHKDQIEKTRLLNDITLPLTRLAELGKEALERYKKSQYEIMVADLHYIRLYLDQVDKVVSQIGKENLKKLP